MVLRLQRTDGIFMRVIMMWSVLSLSVWMKVGPTNNKLKSRAWAGVGVRLKLLVTLRYVTK